MKLISDAIPPVICTAISQQHVSGINKGLYKSEGLHLAYSKILVFSDNYRDTIMNTHAYMYLHTSKLYKSKNIVKINTEKPQKLV